jgi:hypothetical protein
MPRRADRGVRRRRGRGAATALAAALALAAAWPRAAGAYRPFDGTDADVADAGDLELELGPVGWVRRGPEDALVVPSLVVNWGFARGWEAVLEGRRLVEVGSARGEPRGRIEDAALSVKHVVREGALQDRPGPSVALELGALLPTLPGDDGAGAQGAVIVSLRRRDLTLHLNGVAAFTRTHEPGAFAGLVAEVHETWAVRPVAEVFVARERGAGSTASALAGAIWRVSDRLSVDGALRVARAGGERAAELRAGVTWAFRVGRSP